MSIILPGVKHVIQKYQIQIGPQALIGDASFRAGAVIQVNDVAPNPADSWKCFGGRYYWYPINEMSQWGYGPFYWFKKVMDSLPWPWGDGRATYVCCSGGIHRSPMMVFTWLLSKGYKQDEILEMFGQKKQTHNNVVSKYRQDISDGTIPDRLPEFYQRMAENPTFCMMGILQLMNLRGSH